MKRGLDAARARDEQMQLKLEAAVERLERAEADLADGRVDLSVQQDEVTDHGQLALPERRPGAARLHLAAAGEEALPT